MFCNLASTTLPKCIASSATTSMIAMAQKGIVFGVQKHIPQVRFIATFHSRNCISKLQTHLSTLVQPPPSVFNSSFINTAVSRFHSYRTRGKTRAGLTAVGTDPFSVPMLSGQGKPPLFRTLATTLNSITYSINPYSTNVSIGSAQKTLANMISNSDTSIIDWKEIDGLQNMNYKQYSLFLGESIKLINENNKPLYQNWYKAVLSLPSLHLVNNMKPSLPPLSSDTAVSSTDSICTSKLLQSLRPLMFEKVIGNEEIDDEFFESRTNALLERMSQTYGKISYEDALYLSASTLNPEYKIMDINSNESDFFKATEDYLVKDVRLVLEQLDHYITTIDSRAGAIVPELYKSNNWSVDPSVSFVLKHNKEMLTPIVVEPYSIASLTENCDGNSARSQMILRKLFSCCLAYAKDTVILTDGFDLTVYKFNITDSDKLKTMVFPIGDGRYGEAYCINYQYKTFHKNDSGLTPKSALASLIYDEYKISLIDRIKLRRKNQIEKLISKITKPEPVMMFDDMKEDKQTKEALIIEEEEISKQWKVVPDKVIHKDVSDFHYEMMQKGTGRLTTTISMPVDEYIDLFEIDSTKMDLTGIKNVIIKLLNFKELGDYYEENIDPQKCTFDQFYDYSLKCHEYEIKAYRIITEYNKRMLQFADPQAETVSPASAIKTVTLPNPDGQSSNVCEENDSSSSIVDDMIIHSPRYLGHGWCCLNSQELHVDGYFLAIEKLEFHECKPQTKSEFTTGLKDIQLMAELGIEHGDLALRNMCYDGSHVYFYDFNRVEMGVLNSNRLLDEYKTRFIDSCCVDKDGKVDDESVVDVDNDGNAEVRLMAGLNQEDPTELGIVNPTDERDLGLWKQ